MRRSRGPKPVAITVTERQRAILAQNARRATSPQRLVTRSKIILKAAAGKNNQQIADELEVKVRTPRLWRGRWAEASAHLTEIEPELSDEQLAEQIEAILTDLPRSGAPPTFTAEQVCQIIAISCENPQKSDREITEWTPSELADEVIKRKIVASISPRSVGRFLKAGRCETSSHPVLAEQ